MMVLWWEYDGHRWWQYDDNFLKAGNFEEPLGPGEDVVEVADVLPLEHLGGVDLGLEHLPGEGVEVVLLGIV